jgi:hypothetical protein
MEAPEDEKPAGIGRLLRRLLDWLRNWRLRSWRTALLGLWISWLIVGVLVIPPIVRKLLIENLRKRAGLEATVRSVRFNPFTLSLTINGVSIADRPGSVLFSADEIYANAELSSLFRWAATLSEFRMENPVIGARRFADGRLNLADVAEEIRRRQPPRAPNPKSSLPRVLLQHIKVRGATIIVEDQARAKPLKMAFGPSVFELSEISTIPRRQGTEEITVRLPGSGVVRATGQVTLQPLGLEGDMRLEDLHLKDLWPLLEPYFRFTVESGELTGRFHYTIAAADGTVRARTSDFESALKNLTVVSEGDRVLEVPAAAITNGRFRWPEAELVVEKLRLERPTVLVGRDADGKMSYERMVPPPTRKVVVQTYQEIEKAARWTVEVGRFEVVDSHGRFVDRTLDPPVSFDAGNIELAITGFTTRPGAFFGVVSSSSLPKGGTTKSSGRVSMKPVRFEVDFALDGLDLTVAQPYLGRLLPFEILSGQGGSKGRVAGGMDQEKGFWAKFAGDLEARKMALRETVTGSTPLKWDAVQVRGVQAGYGPMAVGVESIDVRGAGIDLVISEKGALSISEVKKRLAASSPQGSQRPGASSGPASRPSPTKGSPIPIRVDAITLADCSVALTDRRLPPYTVAVDRVQGTIKGISSSTKAPAPIEIGAAWRGGGEVTLKGAMDLFQPARATNLQVGLHRLEIPPLSPFSVHYLGYPVTKGRGDLGLDYEVKDQEMKGSNHIVTRDLTLGDKVAGGGDVKLPVKLGVSLLTDKDGLITLDFPVEGRLDDPKFGVGTAIGSAMREVVSEVVKSPFRQLAKIGGGKGGGGKEEDVGYVEFPAGSAALDPASAGRLRTLAAALKERPGLRIVVPGGWDDAFDGTALQEAALEKRLAERGSGSSAPLSALESIYLETATREDLAALRRAQEKPGAGGQKPTLDEAAYASELRRRIVASQPIPAGDLETLGKTRAESVRAALVDASGVDASRVELTAPRAVVGSTGGRVRLTLELAGATEAPDPPRTARTAS